MVPLRADRYVYVRKESDDELQVVVLVPVTCRHALLERSLTESLVDADNWRQRMVQDVKSDAGNEFARSDFTHLYRSIVRSPIKGLNPSVQIRRRGELNPEYESPKASALIATSVLFGDQHLFENIMESLPVSTSFLFYDIIGQATASLKLEIDHTSLVKPFAFYHRK